MQSPIGWFTWLFPRGSIYDPAGKEGLCRLTFELMRRGAGDFTRTEFDSQIESLGASLDVDTDRDAVGISGSALGRHTESLFGLARLMLTKPRFDANEFAKLSRETQNDLLELYDDDGSLAERHFYRICAPGHLYGRTVLGTKQSLASITLADIIQHFETTLAHADVIVGGAGTLDDAASGAQWHSIAAQRTVKERPLSASSIGQPDIAPRAMSLVVVDKPARTQCQVAMGHLGPRYGTPVYETLLPALTAFGGTFSSRLMQEIRVKRGWSYGASARMYRGKHPHYLALHTAPSAEIIGQALVTLIDLFRELGEKGVSADEFEFAQSVITGSLPFSKQTSKQIMRSRIQHQVYGLPADYPTTLAERIANLSHAEVNAACRDEIKPSQLAIVVVGSKDQILPQLEKVGLTPQEVVAHDSY